MSYSSEQLRRITSLTGGGHPKDAAFDYQISVLREILSVIEDVLNEDSTNGNAKKLLAAVNAKMAEEEAKVAAAAAAAKKAERPARPAPPPVVERKVVEKKIVEPPKKAEPKKVEPRKVEAAKASEPAAPVDQDKLKGLIKAGRDAYNNGDFPAAIKAYNSALQMDRNNGLVQKLLEQARAKAGQ